MPSGRRATAAARTCSASSCRLARSAQRSSASRAERLRRPDPAKPVTAFIPITAYANPIDSPYYKYYQLGMAGDDGAAEAGHLDGGGRRPISSTLYAHSWGRSVRSNPNASGRTRSHRPRSIASLPTQLRGPDAGPDAPIILWICGVAAIVLLIAWPTSPTCCSAAHSAGSREIAVRLALGATRGRLITQLLIESLYSGFAAWHGGDDRRRRRAAVVAQALFPSNATIGRPRRPAHHHLRLLAALIAGLLTGMAPALHSGREDL